MNEDEILTYYYEYFQSWYFKKKIIILYKSLATLGFWYFSALKMENRLSDFLKYVGKYMEVQYIW